MGLSNSKEERVNPSTGPDSDTVPAERESLTARHTSNVTWWGRHTCSWTTWRRPSLLSALWWYLFSPDHSSIPTEEIVNNTLPIRNFNKEGLPTAGRGIQVTWLGHSTTLVQMEGLNILTDPVISTRASPIQSFGPHKRYRNLACQDIRGLPDIDVVIISHNHYDHLDTQAVKTLLAHRGDTIHWFVPLGVKRWMQDTGCGEESVTELAWWKEHSIKGVQFVFTPAQHWSGRGIFDYNKTLWGTWCVIGKDFKFFFAGDTGYCDVFKEIGEKFGPFDLAAIPIGAYEPRWMMEMQHVDPEQAVKIHQDLKAKKSIAIHWGTFTLANEHYLEPKEKLTKFLKEKKIPNGVFLVLEHGETRSVVDDVSS